MTTYTPTPWTLSPNASEQHNVQVVAADGYTVPVITFQNMDQDRAEVIANAQLVADMATVLLSERLQHITFHPMHHIPSFYTIHLKGAQRVFSGHTIGKALHDAAEWLRQLEERVAA